MNGLRFSAVLLACFLGGCNYLNTSYGSPQPDAPPSVNGCSILYQRLQEEWGLRSCFRPGERQLDRAHLLVYVDRIGNGTAPPSFDELFDDEGIDDEEDEEDEEDEHSFQRDHDEPIEQSEADTDETGAEDDDRPTLWQSEFDDWLEEWYAYGEGDRCLLLFLKQDGLGSWLCERWIAEIDATLADLPADAPQRSKLELAREHLRERRVEEENAPYPAVDEQLRIGDLLVEGRPTTEIGLLGGAIAHDEPPAFLRLSHTVSATADAAGELRILSSAADRHFIVEWRRDGGRMVVVLNSNPFLDAGLVDAASRRLLDDLIDLIASDQSATGEAWWIQRIRPRDGSDGIPTILGMLLGAWPFNVIAGHVLLLILLWVWGRGAWLGRVTPLPDRRRHHFGDHIANLGRQLAQLQAWHGCLQAIAKARHRPPPSAGDREQALRAARRLYDEAPR